MCNTEMGGVGGVSRGTQSSGLPAGLDHLSCGCAVRSLTLVCIRLSSEHSEVYHGDGDGKGKGSWCGSANEQAERSGSV